MDNTKTTKMLLDTYYEGFAKKKDWEAVIADDFKYIGGNMANQDPINGKAGYVTVINRFSLIFQQMRVKKMIVDGDNACVIGNYDFKFPNGVKMNGNSQVVLNRLHRQSRTPARIIVPVPKEIGFVDAIFIVTGNRHPQVSGNR